MNFTMNMERITDLNNITSYKAMGYLYNDLIARCEEKWNDWTPAFIGLFDFIKEVALVCDTGLYKKEWNEILKEEAQMIESESEQYQTEMKYHF